MERRLAQAVEREEEKNCVRQMNLLATAILLKYRNASQDRKTSARQLRCNSSPRVGSVSTPTQQRVAMGGRDALTLARGVKQRIAEAQRRRWAKQKNA